MRRSLGFVQLWILLEINYALHLSNGEVENSLRYITYDVVSAVSSRSATATATVGGCSNWHSSWIKSSTYSATFCSSIQPPLIRLRIGGLFIIAKILHCILSCIPINELAYIGYISRPIFVNYTCNAYVHKYTNKCVYMYMYICRHSLGI